MEDSFSDFKKKKNIKTGPKVDPKDKRNNQKKSLKRSKGQKDIRSLIKKNELVSFTQDFEEVCKQSGVDVDAEQLQLAVALSKSINEFQSSSEDVQIQNKQLLSQERSAKIRTTLQEYGFKVNNSKILLSLSKNKRKKYNKHSRLLKISSEERQLKIFNKYSQVLASNICKSSDEDPKCCYLKHTIFYKATNIPYDNIKNDNTYYVSTLIDKPTHKTCQLRDWSKIPGRPVSPKPMYNDINFETMQYSQKELDNILSGSVDTAQSIINSKQHVKNDQSLLTPSKDINCIKNNPIDTIVHTPCSNNSKHSENQLRQMSDNEEITEVQVNDIQVSEKKCSFKDCSRNSLKVTDSQSINSRQFRSASPDLFDDEVYSIIEDNCSTIEANEVCSIIEDKNNYSTIEINEVCSIIEDKNNYSTIEANEVCSIIEDNCSTIEINEVCSIIEEKPRKGTRESLSKYDNCGTIFMDLTECANNIDSNINIDNTDTTKRKSNDLMDITECVKPNNNNIDVILSSGETNEDNVELVDLTQVSNSGNLIAEIDKSGTKDSDSLDTDDTIIYDNVVFTNTLNEHVEPIELCDEEGVAKDMIIDRRCSEYDNTNHNSCKSDEENVSNSLNFIENVEFNDNLDDVNIDLTQGSAQSEDLLNYPEYIYDDYRSEALEHDSGENNDKDNDIISLKSVSYDNHIENQDVDLTQVSEKCLEIVEENYEMYCPGTSRNNNSDLDFHNNFDTIDNKNNSIISVESLAINNKPVDKNNEDKIDLTQGTEENELNIAGNSYLNKNNSKLGKINNISIDYDEMFDEIASESRSVSKNFKNNSSEKVDVNCSNPSINSEVFEISDKELNYSIHHSIHEYINMDLEGPVRLSLNRSLSDGFVSNNLYKLSPIKEKNNSQPNTSIKINKDIGDAIIQTPKNNEYIIKTRAVTPMADYESMTSPERNEELEKYGLKPFKRKRAIQLLTYVYNQTHPVIQSCSPEEGPSKRLKKDRKYASPKKKSKSPKKCLDFGPDVNKENDIFLVTKETPDIKDVECDPKEWVFQNRQKAKVHSCRVPLHIAFHNYVSCRKLLREAILRYEPVNIDVIHRDLVSYGHKYNPKDLLKFMDRKCITVKTVENNLRNKKV